MKPSSAVVLILILASTVSGQQQTTPQQVRVRNPAIDMEGYLRNASAAAKVRETHRVSEEDFLQMMREPDTIILDARSATKFRELHIKGAVNLSYPDIAVDSLHQTIPDKGTRILIYCNNNFTNATGPFPTKLPTASLNLATYVALYNYGYRNVYELAPTVDLRASHLPFESDPSRGTK